jgi:hypothetical protein
LADDVTVVVVGILTTVVFEVLVLLAGTASGVLLLTVAVLETVVEVPTFATSVNVYGPPTGSDPALHVTVPFVPTAGCVQLNPDPAGGVMDWNVVPAGRTSVTTTFVAVEGPALFNVIGNVAFWPAFIDAGPTLVIDRSAEVVTVVVAVAVLLAGVASAVELLTFAVLVIVVPGATPGLTLTIMVNVTVCPAGRVGRVAVTAPGVVADALKPVP